MSKAVFFVALLVLAIAMNVSGQTVTQSVYLDSTCGKLLTSVSYASGECKANGNAWTKFVCNGTVVDEYVFLDSACNQTLSTQPTVFPNGQCYHSDNRTTTAVKYTCGTPSANNSSAWMFAPSVVLIAMVAALASFGAKSGF